MFSGPIPASARIASTQQTARHSNHNAKSESREKSQQHSDNVELHGARIECESQANESSNNGRNSFAAKVFPVEDTQELAFSQITKTMTGRTKRSAANIIGLLPP